MKNKSNSSDLDSKTLPSLFIGHGSPLKMASQDDSTIAWSNLGNKIMNHFDIEGIIVISAHWLTDELKVSTQERPPTIHDFYGFPKELYKMKYPALGIPKLYNELINLGIQVKPDNNWGLDHGAYSILHHMFPKANFPVAQISLPRQYSLENLYLLGSQLRPLRKERYLLIGSGNIVHNLGHIDWNLRNVPHDWAKVFQDDFINLNHDLPSNFIRIKNHPQFKLAAPTSEHLEPFFIIAGSKYKNENMTWLLQDQYEYGSISMASMAIGL